MNKKAKDPGISTGMTKEQLADIVKKTAIIAKRCSEKADERLKEFIKNKNKN